MYLHKRSSYQFRPGQGIGMKRKSVWQNIDDKHLQIRFELEDSLGGVLAFSYRLPLGVKVTKAFIRNFPRSVLLQDHSAQTVEDHASDYGMSIKEAKKELRSQRDTLLDVYLPEVLRHFLDVLPQAIEQSLNESAVMAHSKLKNRAIRLDKRYVIFIDNEEDQATPKAFLNSLGKSAKSRLDIKRGGSKSEYSWDGFGAYYLILYPMAKRAKSTYTRIKKDRGWLNKLKEQFPMIHEDLLERFSMKGPNASPKAIALEQAARACDIPPDKFKVKHLSNRLVRWRAESSSAVSKRSVHKRFRVSDSSRIP
jgi:hypothetical protein